MDFRIQAEAWFKGLQNRKRKPVKPGTLAVYRSYLNTWIKPRLGNVEIAMFGNAAMKTFAASLNTPAQPLGPKSQNEVVAVVKQIIASAVNENGDKLYPRDWNHAFIDLPQINKREQKAPSLTVAEVTHAVRCAPRPIGTFYAMLAGTGLRIGEALAVRVGPCDRVSAWDPEKLVVAVRTQLWRAMEIDPKTEAGVRDVDLHPRLNQLLINQAVGKNIGDFLFQSERGGHMYESTLRKYSLQKLGIPGFHAFRRFRITRLREMGCPEDIVRYWAGHEGEGITDRYSKLAQNVELRRSWAARVGYGFDLWTEEEKENAAD